MWEFSSDSKMKLMCMLSICFFAAVQSKAEEAENINGTFWHITDLHLDKNYSLHADPRNMCHGPDRENSSSNGLYGNFLCDSPQNLIDLTLKFMAKQKPNPDFILWTGDNSPHQHPAALWNEVLEEMAKLTKNLTDTFPETQIYPSIGNHDTAPPNVISPLSNTIYIDYLDLGGWRKLLPNSTLATFTSGGYYSHMARVGLKVISLNTILWYSSNPEVANETDSRQLTFLRDELSDAQNKNQKVYIIGHVPPGFYNRHNKGELSQSLYYLPYLKEYLVIIKQYSSVISGQFFGHVHNDMFQIYKCDTDHAVSSGLLAGSITPWYMVAPDNSSAVTVPVNPSVRLVYYDQNSSLLLDYEQYYLNLTEINMKAEMVPPESTTYKLFYTFTQAYGVPDLSTKSLAAVYDKLKTNDSLFKTFFNYLSAGKEFLSCDDDCRNSQLCSMGAVSHDEYVQCMQPTQNSDTTNSYAVQYAIGFTCISIILITLIVLYLYKRKNMTRRRQGYDNYHGF